mmetsp:Transcript_11053/g.24363  ORF Transcript_11053/g.24363 Transcript_11053/m.24363 type:complete len:137 (-) Transcript_11053:444-854(-)
MQSLTFRPLRSSHLLLLKPSNKCCSWSSIGSRFSFLLNTTTTMFLARIGQSTHNSTIHFKYKDDLRIKHDQRPKNGEYNIKNVQIRVLRQKGVVNNCQDRSRDDPNYSQNHQAPIVDICSKDDNKINRKCDTADNH